MCVARRSLSRRGVSAPALLGRGQSLHDHTVDQAESPVEAVLAERAFLYPAIPQHLDAQALVVGVVAREVAVRLELDNRVAADEEELLIVAHVGQIGITGDAGSWTFLVVAMIHSLFLGFCCLSAEEMPCLCLV